MGKHKHDKTIAHRNSTDVPAFRLPEPICKCGKALLDQQMWCWGCDVRRKSGNLLLAYGFEQRPSPEQRHHSAYTCCLKPDCTLTLWGWGLWIAVEEYGSLFLSRSGFRVRHTAEVEMCPQAWHMDDLPPVKMPCDQTEQRNTLHLLAEALVWIGEYERWLAQQVEPQYREQVIAAWPQRRRYRGGVSAADLAHTWTNLSKAVNKEIDDGWKTQNHAKETHVWQ